MSAGAIEWERLLRPRASLTCDAPGCAAEIEAFGDTFAQADEKMRRMAIDAGWRADDLDASFAEASRMMGAEIARVPGAKLEPGFRVKVKRDDRCPACVAKGAP